MRTEYTVGEQICIRMHLRLAVYPASVVAANCRTRGDDLAADLVRGLRDGFAASGAEGEVDNEVGAEGVGDTTERRQAGIVLATFKPGNR